LLSCIQAEISVFFIYFQFIECPTSGYTTLCLHCSHCGAGPQQQRCRHWNFIAPAHCSFTLVHAPVRTVCVRAARSAPWIIGVRRMKPVVLRNFTVATKQKMMKSCGKLSLNFNGSSFNRNSEATRLQQLIRAEVT